MGVPFETGTLEAKKPSKHRGLKIGAGVTALAALIAVDIAVWETRPNSAERRAEAIERSLNNHEVAKGLTVEMGYDLPVHIPEEPDITGINNPMKLGNNIYAYMKIDHDKGKVEVKTVHTTAKLKPAGMGNARFHPHEVTTSAALVYHVYNTGSPDPNIPGKEARYYSVVTGAEPGDERDSIHIDPSLPQAEQDAQLAKQFGLFAENRIGDLLHSGR